MNKYGCRVSKDVCIAHDEPLLCKHGCTLAMEHICKEARDNLAERQGNEGCKVSQDRLFPNFCVTHDEALICKHGCTFALNHKCKEADEYWDQREVDAQRN